MSRFHNSTFTVCEDHFRMNDYDVEIRTFPTLAAARAWARKQYGSEDAKNLSAYIRHDATGEALEHVDLGADD